MGSVRYLLPVNIVLTLRADMNYGQVFRFNGNKCWHYNKVNETGVTRVHSCSVSFLALTFRSRPVSIFGLYLGTSIKKMKTQDRR